MYVCIHLWYFSRVHHFKTIVFTYFVLYLSILVYPFTSDIHYCNGNNIYKLHVWGYL